MKKLTILGPSPDSNEYISNEIINKYFNTVKILGEEYEWEYWGNEEDDYSRSEIFAESLDLCMIGHGDTRTTFIYKGYALKIAHCKDGEEDNKKEIDLWNFSSNEVKKYLVPILYGTVNYLIMPLGEFIYEMVDYKKIEKELEKLGYAFYDLDKQDNFVNLNGEIKICDYADYYKLNK